MQAAQLLFSWVKRNKLTTVLLLFLFYLLFIRNNLPLLTTYRPFLPSPKVEEKIGQEMPEVFEAPSTGISRGIIPAQEYTPQPDVSDRLVVKESNLSLLVNDVFGTISDIKNQAENLGGYLVESSLTNPTDVAFGRITVRVPQENLENALSYFRSLSVRVVSENLVGRDVTDEYVDIEARRETLNKTKAKFEDIMAQALEISDILNIQREIINLQSQIDQLKGRQQYLEQTARLSKVTVFISTDELALPYAPSEPWRPDAIFKQAVRSLIGTLRSVATVSIWIAVYSVLWLPVLLSYFLFRKLRKQRD